MSMKVIMMVFEEDKLNSYNEKQLNEAENDIENIILYQNELIKILKFKIYDKFI